MRFNLKTMLIVVGVLGLSFGVVAKLLVDPIQFLSNERLIEERLASQTNDAEVWNELTRRINIGHLSQPECERILQVLAAYIENTRPNGWNDRLKWQQDFISRAISEHLISDAVIYTLCDAFFGRLPRLQTTLWVMDGKPGIRVDVQYDNRWSGSTGLGIDLLWNMKQVELNGVPINAQFVNGTKEWWLAHAEGDFKPGEYKLSVEVECAYVDATNLRYASPLTPQLLVTQWPVTRKRWTSKVTVPLIIGLAESQ